MWQSLRDWLDTSNDTVEEPIVVPETSRLVEDDGEVSAAQPQ
jgi:hypothetical protein